VKGERLIKKIYISRLWDESMKVKVFFLEQDVNTKEDLKTACFTEKEC
jgi:hypothetical protein